MSPPLIPSSTLSPLKLQNPADAAPDGDSTPSAIAGAPQVPGILAESWPTLSRAMGRYQQNVAEDFSRLAYEAVDAGIIRHDQRRRLAAAAEAMGIRPFDAQLLIACAIRQWSLDRAYDPSPSRRAPALSFEYQSWSRVCMRVALILSTAVIMDAIIIWKWLS